MKENLVVISIVVLALLTGGCATTSTKTRTGAGTGAILGGVAGVFIDKDNPWRGGIVGAAAGALIGGTIGNIMDRATEEAATKNKTAQYTRTYYDDTRETIRATPCGYSEDGNYKLIKIQIIRNGVVVKEEVKKVPID